jgi:hypothetical protein
MRRKILNFGYRLLVITAQCEALRCHADTPLRRQALTPFSGNV